jgi:membrane carboxypeptidase/penicillin-binding protein
MMSVDGGLNAVRSKGIVVISPQNTQRTFRSRTAYRQALTMERNVVLMRRQVELGGLNS